MARNVMRRFSLHEISGVDSPAQKGAVVAIMKRDFTADDRNAAAASGAAMPDGSFPIKTAADLKNAVQAFGRANDPAKAKAHIIARAKALDAESALPEGWITKSDGDKGARDMSAELEKKLAEATANIEALTKSNAEAVAKLAKFEAENGELKKAADLAKNDETFTALGQTIRKSEVGPASFAFMKAQQDQIELGVMTKRAETEFANLPGEAVAKARVLKAAAKMPKEEADELEKMLKAGDAALKTLGIEKGRGQDVADGDGTPLGKLDAMAKEVAKAEKISVSKAYAQVLETDAGRAAYKAEQDAKRRRAA